MEIPLILLDTRRKARIKRIEGGLEFKMKTASLNVRTGKTVKKIATQPFRGPVIIEIDGRKITIGRGMASRIFVEVEG